MYGDLSTLFLAKVSLEILRLIVFPFLHPRMFGELLKMPVKLEVRRRARALRY
jgi:hypothetical protein